VNATRGFATPFRRVGGLLLAATVSWAFAFSTTASTAAADTKSSLGAAKARLAALETQIADQEQALATLNGKLTDLGTRLAAATARYQATLAQLARSAEQLQAARDRYQAIRQHLNARAAATYMQGSGSILEVVLGASSYLDFTDRIEFVTTLSRSDASLGAEAERAAAELIGRQQVLDGIRTLQAATVKELDAQQAEVAKAFADEQAAVASLSTARAQASTLVTQLANALAKEQLQAALTATQRGTPIPFGDWAGLLLPRLGAPTCQNNLVLVVAWEATEYTRARYNPLATSYPMPGATIFAGAVKNYVSLDQGLQAEVYTLESTNPLLRYAPIVADLRACADPVTTAQAINNSAYCECSGSYPLPGLVPFVETNYQFYAKICTGC
jgi:peptidoglycan hydrolase CwlO-like protein